MRAAPSSRVARRCQRGISIVESLVAVVVVAAGTAAAAQLQSRLALAGDVARERSEAVRIGMASIEEMRSFAVLGGGGERTYAAIASGESSVDATSASSTLAASSPRGSFRVERGIDDAGFAAGKSARVRVRWNDRSGAARMIVLDSFIAAAAPAYSGSLALGAGAIEAAPRGPADRVPGLPRAARNLGDGRSAWKPRERGTAALVFDNRSGAIVGRCDGIAATMTTRDLTASSLAACATGRWLLVSGTIRFSATTPPNAAAPEESPLATTVAIALRDGVYPAPAACFSEARRTVRAVADGALQIVDVSADAGAGVASAADAGEGGDRFIAWHCVVTPRADGRWSGRIELLGDGWTIGRAGTARRVCRYVGAGADAIDANIASAGDDTDVGVALTGRNFLVVRGSESCPSARTARTEPHQP